MTRTERKTERMLARIPDKLARRCMENEIKRGLLARALAIKKPPARRRDSAHALMQASVKLTRLQREMRA